MATNIIQNVVNFTDQYILMPYRNSSVVAALGDNRKFSYSLYGEATAVREISGVNSKSYDGCNGWSDQCETVNPWHPFTANIDREISFRLDLLKETNTILPGMIPTGELTYEMSWRLMGAEIDAVSMSQLDYQIPTANKIADSTAGFKTDPDNIILTMTNLEAWLTNQKVYGGAAVFMSASTFKNLRTAMIQNYGLASGAMLRLAEGVSNPLDRLYGDSGRILEVNTEIYRWGDLFIYQVPDDRMINKVVLLDGRSAGQTAGGWLPDVSDPDFHYIDMMVVPFESAAVGVRHIIKEVMVPSVYRNYTPTGPKLEQDLAKLRRDYNGIVDIQNIGITQQGDMFRWVGRVVWGLPVFNNWAHTILEIYNATAVPPTKITSVTVTPNPIPATGGEVNIDIAGTSLVSAYNVTAYINSTPIEGATGTTSGSTTLQSVKINIPANTGTEDITITFEISNSGSMVEQKSITQSKPD